MLLHVLMEALGGFWFVFKVRPPVNNSFFALASNYWNTGFYFKPFQSKKNDFRSANYRGIVFVSVRWMFIKVIVNNKMNTAFVRIYMFINNELKIIPWYMYVYTVKQWIQ